MAIRFTCPRGHRLKVPDEKAGRGMLCPICEEPVTVPAGIPDERGEQPPQPPPIDEPPLPSADLHPDMDESHSVPEPVVTPPTSTRREIRGTSIASIATPGRANSIPWGITTGLFLVLAYSVLPAIGHLQDVPMPGWTRLLLGAALFQVVFVLWMLTVRHWVALAIVAGIFVLVSFSYAMIAAFAFGGTDYTFPWGIESIRPRAAVWSATVLAVYLLATYCCGLAAARWRQAAIDERTRQEARRSPSTPD